MSLVNHPSDGAGMSSSIAANLSSPALRIALTMSSLACGVMNFDSRFTSSR